MCGIAGFFVNGGSVDGRPTLRRMTDSLRHRGPDDEGFYVDESVALGVRRLSIIDLETGRQPIANEDGTVWVVQNGEIYNFRELRDELERRGHRFRTASDTEVVVHAYEEYGGEFVSRLDGMFALAVWDAVNRSLILARDRMGEKPLYYYAGPDAFVFGSELRALLEHPAVPRELDLESLSRYLAFEYVPAPHSILVAVAARLSGTRRLQTFSLGFEEASYDERPFARLIAQQCGTEHGEIVFSARDARALLEDVGGLLDEPLVDGSFLPTYVLSRFARQAVTVVLSGDGGDELFCGYPTFIADRGVRWARHLPAWGVRWATSAINRLPPSSRYGSVEFLLKQFVRGLPHPPEARTQLLLGGLSAAEQVSLLSPGVRAACAGFDPYEDLTRAVADVPGLGSIDRLIYQHCKFYLAEQNLATVDRASMASGLEVRAPF